MSKTKGVYDFTKVQVPPAASTQSPDDGYMRPVPPLYFNQSPTEPAPLPPMPSHPPPAHKPLPSQPYTDTTVPPLYGSTSQPHLGANSSEPPFEVSSSPKPQSLVGHSSSTVRLPQPVADREREERAARKKRESQPDQMDFLVDDVPPWYLCIPLAFQHYLVMFGATLANPLALAPVLCISDKDSYSISILIGTIFVVSGIATFIQATFGVRLPIVQGGTFMFVAPINAILSLEKYKCPKASILNQTMEGTVTMAMNLTMEQPDDLWKIRIREVQGAIMVASLFQVLIGFSGLMGLLLRFIGPLAIAPTITLAGLALFDVAASTASKQWWVTLVTVVLIAAFSQYTKNIDVPCFTFERGKGCHKIGFPLFRLFPVILAMSIVWIICAILTAANVFPSDPKAWGYGAQTSLRIDVLESSPWFRIPYPGQWGMPTVSVAGVFGMLAGVLASMVESVGDYYACARISGAKPPPVHAINRGIGIEGIACVIAGAWGSSSGTTSYSENIGAIGITKVSSRRVIQWSAVMMVVFGIFGKLGSLFATIPDPINGGMFIVMFGMVTAVGISNLQYVNLNSSRNLFIIGISFFVGLILPKYMRENSGIIKTGSEEVDQIFSVLLQTAMFVGGMTGFVLDNTIPGTDEERGLTIWREHPSAIRRRHDHDSDDETTDTQDQTTMDTYDLPFITPALKRQSWTRFVPFLPTFQEDLCSFRKKGRRKRKGKKQKRRQKAETDSADETV